MKMVIIIVFVWNFLRERIVKLLYVRERYVNYLIVGIQQFIFNKMMKNVVLYQVSNQLFNYFLVNGGWSNWNVFFECLRICGGGVKFRFCICNNLFLDFDGLQCDFIKLIESMVCNV